MNHVRDFAFASPLSTSARLSQSWALGQCIQKDRGREFSRTILTGRTPRTLPVREEVHVSFPSKMAVTTDFPALIKRHLGTWEGTYHIIDPKSGGTIDRHRCKIEVGIRGERYSQRNTYIWDDGRQEIYEFAGRMIDGELRVASERVDGRVVVLGRDAICFTAERKGTDMQLYDVITLLTEDTRARTWQVTQGESMKHIVHVEETRTSKDDTYFEVGNDPWGA